MNNENNISNFGELTAGLYYTEGEDVRPKRNTQEHKQKEKDSPHGSCGSGQQHRGTVRPCLRVEIGPLLKGKQRSQTFPTHTCMDTQSTQAYMHKKSRESLNATASSMAQQTVRASHIKQTHASTRGAWKCTEHYVLWTGHESLEEAGKWYSLDIIFFPHRGKYRRLGLQLVEPITGKWLALDSSDLINGWIPWQIHNRMALLRNEERAGYEWKWRDILCPRPLPVFRFPSHNEMGSLPPTTLSLPCGLPSPETHGNKVTFVSAKSWEPISWHKPSLLWSCFSLISATELKNWPIHQSYSSNCITAPICPKPLSCLGRCPCPWQWVSSTKWTVVLDSPLGREEGRRVLVALI